MKTPSKILNAAAAALLLGAAALGVCGCDKQSIQALYAKQEGFIESFVKTQMAKDETYTVHHNDGTTRLVLVQGEGVELSPTGKVTLMYAGFTLTSGSLATNNLFATNNPEFAQSVGWNVTDAESLAPVQLDLSGDKLVPGLLKGLPGVKAGEQCVVLFSGASGFGSKKLGTIPANAAIAYQLWVLAVEN